MLSATAPTNSVSTPETPTAAYVHIPFCRRRCFYCDFPISVVGDRPPLSRQQPDSAFGAIAAYVELLCQEIEITATSRPSMVPLQTVFLGGGTPSLLSAAQLEQILTRLDRQIGIAPAAEISMEMDPGTFDLHQLQGYKAAGINRVSLGAQAFQAELLAACGRTHRPEDIQTAVELLQRASLTNFSLDLISGLPHLTLEQWQNSLQAAIALAPTHLSIYDLTLEPGTAFDRWYQPGTPPLPSEAATAQMYRLAQQMLTGAGYEHYEISNYARSGYHCRHNRIYWENRPYYGFGMAAASYVDGQRFTRPRTRREYYQWVQTLAATGGSIDCPVTPASEVWLDTLMLGFRLAEGLSLSQLMKQFGQPAVEQLLAIVQPYEQQGWVELLTANAVQRSIAEVRVEGWQLDDRLRLSDPEGFLFSNLVLTALFEKFEQSDLF